MKYVRKHAVLVALLFVVIFTACATVQSGQDPVVVHSQQGLAIGQEVYNTGMAWCTANAGKLSAAGLALANKIRVDFPLAYRTYDAALDTYKSGKAGDFTKARDDFENLVAQLSALITAFGGPDLKAQATAKLGGTS